MRMVVTRIFISNFRCPDDSGCQEIRKSEIRNPKSEIGNRKSEFRNSEILKSGNRKKSGKSGNPKIDWNYKIIIKI